VDTLEAAASGASIMRALDAAFRGSEFARLELRVEESLARGFDSVDVSRGHALADASGSTVSLTFEHLLNPPRQVELRVPLYLEDRRVGALSLYRSAEGDRLYTDVRLLAQRLAPALVGSLQRAAAGASDLPDAGLDGFQAL
jgi:hypothetical protein